MQVCVLKMIKILVFMWLTFSQYGKCILRCSQDKKPKLTEYYFVNACTRSIMKLIAKRNYDSLDSCEKFAARKKAFAFNFVQKDILHPVVKNFSGESCLIYDCPEFDTDISLDRSNVYDYYSAYARPLPNTNVSCIPKLGVFQLHKMAANYTEAESRCTEEAGTLAKITSRYHTEQLASLMASDRVREAYVGLSRQQHTEEFLSAQGLPLNCLEYRAWQPGEPKPKKNANCVLLTSQGKWKISKCDRRLPFLCELTPNGPYRPCRQFYNKRRREKCRKIFKVSLPNNERYPKCGDPSASLIFKKRRNLHNA